MHRRRERNEDDVARALAEAGRHPMDELAAAVQAMRLDNRREPMLRADQDEEHLARLLLAAAWYAVNLRNPFAFGDTPLCKTVDARPEGFDLAALLAVLHRDLVEDLLPQLHRAENGSLERRDRTRPVPARPDLRRQRLRLRRRRPDC